MPLNFIFKADLVTGSLHPVRTKMRKNCSTAIDCKGLYSFIDIILYVVKHAV